MPKYLEFKQWFYIVQNGKEQGQVFVNLSLALATINGEPDSFMFSNNNDSGFLLENTVSFNKLKKDLTKCEVDIKELKPSEVDFLKDYNGEVRDKYSSAEKDGIKAISSYDLIKIIKYENSKKPQIRDNSNSEYKYISFGQVVRKVDNRLFISISRTLYDIIGYGYPSGYHQAPAKPSPSVPLDVLRRKAASLAKEHEADGFEVIDDTYILIKPSNIEYPNSVSQYPKNAEVYVSIPLHDLLYNFYSTKDKYDGTQRKNTIKEIVTKIPSLRLYAESNPNGLFDLSQDDIKAYDKNIKDKILAMEKVALTTLERAQNDLNHYRYKAIRLDDGLSEINTFIRKHKDELSLYGDYIHVIIDKAKNY